MKSANELRRLPVRYFLGFFGGVDGHLVDYAVANDQGTDESPTVTGYISILSRSVGRDFTSCGGVEATFHIEDGDLGAIQFFHGDEVLQYFVSESFPMKEYEISASRLAVSTTFRCIKDMRCPEVGGISGAALSRAGDYEALTRYELYLHPELQIF
jgi:hypothetical protein